MKFKKIPEEKFSWSRVIAMLYIVLPIFILLVLIFEFYCSLNGLALYIENYPELVEDCLSIGCVFTLLVLLIIVTPYSIHGVLKVLK